MKQPTCCLMLAWSNLGFEAERESSFQGSDSSLLRKLYFYCQGGLGAHWLMLICCGFFLLARRLGYRQVQLGEEEMLLPGERQHSLLLRRRWLPRNRLVVADWNPTAP